MTFAEFVIFLAIGAGVYVCLKPVRRWLEFKIFRVLSRGRKGPGPVIDITDYSKKNGPK
jgi:hypothetical protein